MGGRERVMMVALHGQGSGPGLYLLMLVCVGPSVESVVVGVVEVG